MNRERMEYERQDQANADRGNWLAEQEAIRAFDDQVGGLTDIPLYGEPAPYVHLVTGYEGSHRLRAKVWVVASSLMAALLIGVAVDYAVWQAVVRWWPR